MSDNVTITPGSGVTIRADDVSGVLFQYVKLDIGGDGVSKPVVQGGSDGIPVDVLSFVGQTYVVTSPKSGQTWPISAASAIPVSDNAGSITVDAPVGTPVFVRLSDGTNPLTTLPVSGTLTAAQGTAAANSGAWPVKISDGTSAVGISDVSGAKAIKVDVIQSVALAGALADSATFTAGTTGIGVVAGVYNDSIAAPTSGQAGAVRINSARGLHVNLRKSDGTDFATSGAPLRVDPTGSTTQPISDAGGSLTVDGAVTASIKDASGNAFTDINPLAVELTGAGRTRITKNVAMSASQTASALWTPAASKYVYITKIVLAITVAGTLTIFGGTNAEANIVCDGTQATGNRELNFAANPWKATAINDVLQYTSGTGLTGVITIHGYESLT